MNTEEVIRVLSHSMTHLWIPLLLSLLAGFLHEAGKEATGSS